MENLWIILKVLFGWALVVLLRPIIKYHRRFDFFIWLKYDFHRVMISLAVSVLAGIIFLVEPSTMEVFAYIGLPVPVQFPVAIGVMVGGFCLLMPSNNLSK